MTVSQTLEKYGISPSLKFVNDFFINDHKVGGVLCKCDQSLLEMGIGVNLNTTKEFYTNQGLIEASSVFAETGKFYDLLNIFFGDL